MTFYSVPFSYTTKRYGVAKVEADSEMDAFEKLECEGPDAFDLIEADDEEQENVEIEINEIKEIK